MNETSFEPSVGIEDGQTALWSSNGSNSNPLISPPEQFFILPIIGKILNVPAGRCAVLTFREGRRKVFTEGMHVLDRNIPWGVGLIRYVDVRQHSTSIPFTQALCRDGWRGGLAIEVCWRVGDAALIVDIANPVGDLVIAARASVRAIIETTPHDTLFGGIDASVVGADSLGDTVAAKLKANPAVRGIEILRVLITERRGDERRIQIVQTATIERTRVSSDMTLVSQQMDLERQNQALVVLRAETERKRIEEENKVRIQQADIEAEVMRRLIQTKWQQVQLDQAAAIYQQRHEQVLKTIDAHALVLSKAAELGQLEAFGVSSRRRPEFAVGGLEATLNQGLHNLQRMLQVPSLIPAPGQIAQPDDRKALRMRLMTEVDELSDLADVGQCSLGFGRDGEQDHVVVQVGNRTVDVACYPGYPQVPPEVRWADNGQQKASIRWSEDMSLKHLVAMLQEDVDGQTCTSGPVSEP